MILNIEWYAERVNKTFGEMEDNFFKSALKEDFNIKDDTYIRKITYTQGIDDGFVWKISVHYKFKMECKDHKNNV